MPQMIDFRIEMLLKRQNYLGVNNIGAVCLFASFVSIILRQMCIFIWVYFPNELYRHLPTP